MLTNSYRLKYTVKQSIRPQSFMETIQTEVKDKNPTSYTEVLSETVRMPMPLKTSTVETRLEMVNMEGAAQTVMLH